MASISVSGLDKLTRNFKAAVERIEKQVVDYRRQIAAELTERLMDNIPVWSGRTISSMTWSNTGIEAPLAENPLGKDAKLVATYGRTSKMALGEEPMRPMAEARARASVASLNYAMDKQVTLTIHSTAWGLVERGQAPGDQQHRPRNRGPVSAIAIAQVKAKFGGIVK
jgi:hypothetical protein